MIFAINAFLNLPYTIFTESDKEKNQTEHFHYFAINSFTCWSFANVLAKMTTALD
jgi:hypothetical protein